jgi:hypothetical protein
MDVVQQKKLLIERILPHLIGAPADAAQRLLGQSVSDLETILDDAITKRARAKATEQANQNVADMRAASVSEGAWTHACCALINGKRLALVQSNRDLLESLLNPGETLSAKLYIALAQQCPHRFGWSSPLTTQSDEERRADFALVCRQNNLSECIANEKLHKSGIGIEHWAGASPTEEAAYAEQAALQRNKWLRTEASPLELRAEARYETQAHAAASQQAQADASLQAQKQRDQYAGYKPLPAHIDRKALIKASKDELRKWSRLYVNSNSTPRCADSSKGETNEAIHGTRISSDGGSRKRIRQQARAHPLRQQSSGKSERAGTE